MKHLLAVAFIMFAAPAFGADYMAIPEEYDSGDPIAPVSVFRMPLIEVDATCRSHVILDPQIDYGPLIPGCVVFSKGPFTIGWDDRFDATSCNIFIADGYEGVSLDYILRHEMAHCRGWDHP